MFETGHADEPQQQYLMAIRLDSGSPPQLHEQKSYFLKCKTTQIAKLVGRVGCKTISRPQLCFAPLASGDINRNSMQFLTIFTIF